MTHTGKRAASCNVADNLASFALQLQCADTDEWIVAESDARAVGTLFVQSLLTLKHLGALAQTADALQTVCQQLLSHGTKHAPLAALPQLWLDDLLSKLDNAFKQGLVRNNGFRGVLSCVV